jgi:hypothetical protein
MQHFELLNTLKEVLGKAFFLVVQLISNCMDGVTLIGQDVR